ncbi:hypothetical protein RCC89_02505 [Cytophagaceae bacterium ABcell3]|nr:hypothetical protein RCC89_02505 [Cytophagaceae bacterium ABcell3]
MLRKIFNQRILACVLLYIWQSILDLNKDSLISQYEHLRVQYLSIIDEPLIAKMPAMFICLYILHRAFVHGLIVRVFTSKKALLRQYMALDLIIFVAAIPFYISRKLIPATADFIEPLSFAFMKLLDSPVLLLFFLPSYYLFKNMENYKTASAPDKNSQTP